MTGVQTCALPIWELEKQRLELENLDIIGMVRSMGLTPDQLAALIQGARPTETKEATDYE